MHLAVQSQPPGSVKGALRITEQGEMVQAKFGIPATAMRQLEIYTTAVLKATLNPPEQPKDDSWRLLMDKMSEIFCASYSKYVKRDENFLAYFKQVRLCPYWNALSLTFVQSPLTLVLGDEGGKGEKKQQTLCVSLRSALLCFSQATPEAELGNLNIGSRPSRRKKSADFSSLRAIPWIFAWTQTRLVLPAWLGVGDALKDACEKGFEDNLKQMYREWPFFQVHVLYMNAHIHICTELLRDLTLYSSPPFFVIAICFSLLATVPHRLDRDDSGEGRPTNCCPVR